MGVKITKMQGCGNDFVILDYEEFVKLNLSMSDTAKKLCDRHFGIGADGLIIPNTNVGKEVNNNENVRTHLSNAFPCFVEMYIPKGIETKIENKKDKTFK